MTVRCWSACGDSAMFSGTLQVVHMTSSSTSGSVVRGSAASAGRGRSASEDEHERGAARPHAPTRSSASSTNSCAPGRARPRRPGPRGRRRTTRGRRVVPNSSPSSPSTSRRLGNEIPYSRMNAFESSRGVVDGHAEHRAALAFSSRGCARSSSGASSLHGSHHEAQKFTITGLPRQSASDASPPASSGSARVGAARLLARLDRVVERRRPARPDDAVDQQRDQRERDTMTTRGTYVRRTTPSVVSGLRAPTMTAPRRD